MRLVPHLLTEEQKTQRLKCAREILNTYKGSNSRVIQKCPENDKFGKDVVRNFF